MENERLLSERLLSVDEMHADCKMKPLGELLISQDAKTMAARDKWWVTEIDKHLKQFQGYEYIDNEWWQSLKKEINQWVCSIVISLPTWIIWAVYLLNKSAGADGSYFQIIPTAVGTLEHLPIERNSNAENAKGIWAILGIRFIVLNTKNTKGVYDYEYLIESRAVA